MKNYCRLQDIGNEEFFSDIRALEEAIDKDWAEHEWGSCGCCQKCMITRERFETNGKPDCGAVVFQNFLRDKSSP